MSDAEKVRTVRLCRTSILNRSEKENVHSIITKELFGWIPCSIAEVKNLYPSYYQVGKYVTYRLLYTRSNTLNVSLQGDYYIETY